MVLAQCIQREIAKVSGIANDGAKSDGVIYRTGFSVLRNTQMPGVLLEMGFVDSARDRRRIVTDEFRDAITSAVVKGIKEYLGDAKISG
jgi:N-acetylmuramoyl-L-alanine amidase